MPSIQHHILNLCAVEVYPSEILYQSMDQLQSSDDGSLDIQFPQSLATIHFLCLRVKLYT